MYIQIPVSIDRVNETINYGTDIRVGIERYIESNSEIFEIYEDVQTALATNPISYEYMSSRFLEIGNVYEDPYTATSGWLCFKSAKDYGCDGENVIDYGCAGGLCQDAWMLYLDRPEVYDVY